MRYSQRQIEVWKAREELDRELAGMTPQEIFTYLESATKQWEAKTGKKLKVQPVEGARDRASLLDRIRRP